MTSLLEAVCPSPVVTIFHATPRAAMIHKARFGGWVFIPEDEPGAHWFSGDHFTRSSLTTHESVRGLKGTII